MTEEDARDCVAAMTDDAGMARLERFLKLLTDESGRQNLVSRASLESFWLRHALDSIQLVRFDQPGLWLDVGTGAGMPGLLLAAGLARAVTLVEQRPKRTAFLSACANALGIDRLVTVVTGSVRLVEVTASVISARAVASIPEILAMTSGCRGSKTSYVLPRGRNVAVDVDEAKRDWRGMFHVERSLTNEDAGIVIASNVRSK